MQEMDSNEDKLDVFYRPKWTCGRYNKEKKAALMYNLIGGYSFFFESFSAAVIGHILAIPRNQEVNVEALASSTGIAVGSILDFCNLLCDNGLLTDHVFTKEETATLRSRLALQKKQQQAWVDKTTVEKLPMDVSNAEQQYFDAVDDGCTVCSVLFELTYRCSEMCIHCYNPGATRNAEEVSHRADLKELTLDEYKQIIDELYELGLTKVCLSGGDPFSKEIAWELIDYLYQKEIAFDVFTNGQRMLRDVKRLADYYPRLVGVSIYSGVAEDHDAITRIPGSWKRSMQVVDELSRLAVPMNLKCCVMQPNLHTYYMVADLAKQYGAQPQFEINITESNDGDICAKQLRLTEEQLRVVLRDNNLALYVGREAPNYGGQEKLLDTPSCGAAYTGFCITPDGSVRPCPAFPLKMGDLRERSMKDILTNGQTLAAWRKAQIKDYAECGKYDYCAYCNLCAGVNYTEYGDYRQPAETNCFMAKVRCTLAHDLMKNDVPMSRDEFVKALQALPKAKVELKRTFNTKG